MIKRESHLKRSSTADAAKAQRGDAGAWFNHGKERGGASVEPVARRYTAEGGAAVGGHAQEAQVRHAHAHAHARLRLFP